MNSEKKIVPKVQQQIQNTFESVVESELAVLADNLADTIAYGIKNGWSEERIDQYLAETQKERLSNPENSRFASLV